ncbi:maltose alpha-D-glucosyltransferase [Microlunatus ginsengisoli]|uniref:Maltose alpha-D-glucosyltransferase n=2 Tax=Microlunatus ginsengisoli TaxID=363863 RepID=A0ABP7AYH8_9ACTN
MLSAASSAAGSLSAVGGMMQNPFGNPDPRGAIERAPVWFTAYPASMITKPTESFLATLSDDALWAAFESLGIAAVHTGPVKQAGGISGWNATPSVDGQFDRISIGIDETFGSEQEFRRLCDVAAAHGGIVIDDIVPGHTGKGSDFRLAEMNVGDYPGIYHMVEIPPEDWGLLPDVPAGQDSVNLGVDTEYRLEQAGYIVGPLQRVIFHDPGTKDTNWSVTGPVTGADGEQRRWVYLHYFKAGQPSINWLDPTFSGMRLVVGDALHSLQHLGAGALRLDANGFLGLEPANGSGEPAWSEGHPLSDAVNQLIASMVRKMGGFTFQELNLAIEDIKRTAEHGADLSYDFVNRPSYVHALTTGDTEFLRLTLNAALEQDVQPIGLVHALQNHDEMTYELTHFAATHSTDHFRFRGIDRSGNELARLIRSELIDGLTGPAAPYNKTFTTNGISSTLTTICAAALGYPDLAELSPQQVESITRAHLLLAMFNAWQPGVFALSGWDLSGALTVDPGLIPEILSGGDNRWIHRAAYDLMDYEPAAAKSASGMPRGVSLYGPLPRQLADPTSFASRLRSILAVRHHCGIAVGQQLAVPEVSEPALLVMIHRLPDGRTQATALNFSGRPISGAARSEHFDVGAAVINLRTGQLIGQVGTDRTIHVRLKPHAGVSLLVTDPTNTRVH